MLAETRALVVVLARLTATDAAATARHGSEVGVNAGLLVVAGDAAAITRPLNARRSAIGTELEAFVAPLSEADAVTLDTIGVLADELVELLEGPEHELDLVEGPLHFVVLVEVLTQLLLHAEAAVSVAPVDLATAFAAFRFLLLNALLAVAAERGVRSKVRRGAHLALLIVLATVAEEILLFGIFRVRDILRNPRTLGLVPLVKRCLVFLFAVVGILQCHPNRVVRTIHRIIAEDRTEGFFQVIDRKLRRLVRRVALHEFRTIVIHCRVHSFLPSFAPTTHSVGVPGSVFMYASRHAFCSASFLVVPSPYPKWAPVRGSHTATRRMPFS